MTRDVVSVMEDTGIDEVRFLLVNRKIKRVPVLRGLKLVGIVSRADLLPALASGGAKAADEDGNRTILS